MSGKKGVKPHYYTEEELEFLKVNYVTYSAKELTILFNEKFNLNLTPTRIKAVMTRHKFKSGRTGCFEKGNPAFNKGLKWNDYMSSESQAKSRKTCFNSDRSINNANHNEVPVGTERLDKDGYVLVKQPYRTGLASAKFWKYKHHIVWEEVNGTIPKGMNVIFADGNKLNCDIENLILVSNAELLIINQNHLYVKDLPEATKCGATIAKITEKIRTNS